MEDNQVFNPMDQEIVGDADLEDIINSLNTFLIEIQQCLYQRKIIYKQEKKKYDEGKSKKPEPVLDVTTCFRQYGIGFEGDRPSDAELKILEEFISLSKIVLAIYYKVTRKAIVYINKDFVTTHKVYKKREKDRLFINKKPTGLMLHSIGTSQPNASVLVDIYKDYDAYLVESILESLQKEVKGVLSVIKDEDKPMPNDIVQNALTFLQTKLTELENANKSDNRIPILATYIRRGERVNKPGIDEEKIKKWIKTLARKVDCVHAFIDANIDAGTAGTVTQIVPWDYQVYHCGGSFNDTHIGVEICEPDANTITYGKKSNIKEFLNLTKTRQTVDATYKSAVNLFASLCIEYDLDPLGSKENPHVIVSHSEGYKYGKASNHSDPEHLWIQLYEAEKSLLEIEEKNAVSEEAKKAVQVKLNILKRDKLYDMNKFRQDVADAMINKTITTKYIEKS